MRIAILTLTKNNEERKWKIKRKNIQKKSWGKKVYHDKKNFLKKKKKKFKKNENLNLILNFHFSYISNMDI